MRLVLVISTGTPPPPGQPHRSRPRLVSDGDPGPEAQVLDLGDVVVTIDRSATVRAAVICPPPPA